MRILADIKAPPAAFMRALAAAVSRPFAPGRGFALPARRRVLVCGLLLTSLIAAGCATTPRPSAPGTAIPADLNDLDRWQARGRLGVSGPANGGSGSFEWHQVGDRSDVEIRGPVGIGGVRLEMRGDGANPDLTLQTSDGQTLQSDAAWNELQSRLGAAVPAGNLRFWMLGLAAPGEHQWHEANAEGVVALEQGGWRIEYQKYSDEFGARVPMRMTATNGGARVRIVVDRWQLGQ